MRNEAYTMENIFKLNVRSFITVRMKHMYLEAETMLP